MAQVFHLDSYIAERLEAALREAMAAVGVTEEIVRPYYQLVEAAKKGVSIPGTIYSEDSVATGENLVIFGLWVSASNGGIYYVKVRDRPVFSAMLDTAVKAQGGFIWHEPIRVPEGAKVECVVEGGSSTTVDAVVLAYRVARPSGR